MNLINAKIVADSISEKGHRITTMEIVMPRMILAEFATHRLFSKNSASSRAIPFKKMVKSVMETPFIPLAWQKEHSGMQGTEYFENPLTIKALERQWLEARDSAVHSANVLQMGDGYEGLTKQLVNRLLEPFMYHKVLITASEFNNFFNLRCPKYEFELNDREYIKGKSRKEIYNQVDDKGKEILNKLSDLNWLNRNSGMGEIHIMDLAEKMYDILNESTPTLLKAGEWHIPYGDDFDEEKIIEILKEEGVRGNYWGQKEILDIKLKISVARAARLSYQTLGDNPVIDYKKDLELYNTLVNSGHYSPLEHIGRVMDDVEYETSIKGITSEWGYDEGGKVFDFPETAKGWSNNFRGFVQYRAELER